MHVDTHYLVLCLHFKQTVTCIYFPLLLSLCAIMLVHVWCRYREEGRGKGNDIVGEREREREKRRKTCNGFHPSLTTHTHTHTHTHTDSPNVSVCFELGHFREEQSLHSWLRHNTNLQVTCAHTHTHTFIQLLYRNVFAYMYIYVQLF